MNEILYDWQNPEKPEDGNKPTSQISKSSNTACSTPLSESFKFIASFNLCYWNTECCSTKQIMYIITFRNMSEIIIIY